MGYRTDARVTLVLEGYDGAEVDVRIGVPIAALDAFYQAADLRAEWAVFAEWADPSWNLEDAGGAIPADGAAVDRIPGYLSRAIMRGWRDAVVQPPLPLQPPSSVIER